MAEQHALFDVERTWRVGELSARLARAVAAAFPSEVWVQGEVDGHRPANASGHVYFNLCERNSRRGPTTSISVALFRSQRVDVDRSLRDWPDFRLTDGLEVRIRGRLQYSYNRVQLVMSAIDPVHTLGRLAADRERVLRSLTADGLVEANGRLPLPLAPLTVGLVTSAGSAACEDVLQELRDSGFGFRVLLADARVQGVGAEASVTRALTAAVARRPDAVLLVRGGGARTDLATFDGERLARLVASAPVPVITGVGHEIDSSVVDEVAHAACKTPTAAAALLVARVAAARARSEAASSGIARQAVHAVVAADRRVTTASLHLAGRARSAAATAGSVLDARARRIGDLAAARVRGEEARLQGNRRRVDPSRLEGVLRRQESSMAAAATGIRRAAARRLEADTNRVGLLAARAEAADPARILARGFTVTRTDAGRLVRRAADLSPGETLVTSFGEGRARSTVDRIDDHEEDGADG